MIELLTPVHACIVVANTQPNRTPKHNNRNVQEAVVAEVMDVLSQELLVYRYTIAFPEYAFPIQV